MADEMMMEEEALVPEEEVLDEGIAPEEEVEGTPIGATISHSFDELPDLEGASVGDLVTFKISNLGDGQGDLEFLEIAPGEAPQAEVPPAEAVVGQEDLTERFL